MSQLGIGLGDLDRGIGRGGGIVGVVCILGHFGVGLNGCFGLLDRQKGNCLSRENIIWRHASVLINIDSEIAWRYIGSEVYKEAVDTSRDHNINSNPAIK